MFSSHLQSDAQSNLCSAKSNTCEELCLFDGQKANCHCSYRKLSIDGQTCEDHKAFVIFSRVSDIESLHINLRENENPPFPTIYSEKIMRNAIGLAYSYTE